MTFIRSVCSAETPLIECEPTKARLPMRTRRSPLSSISEMLRISWSVAPFCLRASIRILALIA
ncbi:hypothetical protein D3C87_1911100 [compost metagenome]